ncbi:hypothetical protein PoB_006644300 [Plakobranchus ocellatus]|uniref:Uncharacterized protein n=1 Tax=Plakobranchus ocellatus TaxID=259542 RepID=A0AAV4D7B1_9GAST|nr:hypothetical protein PoB_006644300 [Plakobranchus ocellatus]
MLFPSHSALCEGNPLDAVPHNREAKITVQMLCLSFEKQKITVPIPCVSSNELIQTFTCSIKDMDVSRMKRKGSCRQQALTTMVRVSYFSFSIVLVLIRTFHVGPICFVSRVGLWTRFGKATGYRKSPNCPWHFVRLRAVRRLGLARSGGSEFYDPGPSSSVTTPTFSCYMRANPFSKEKVEYLKAHNRRLKEFGPRPYMIGEYPEIPRHYPGVRVVYQWDQIDAVTDRLYYIPQRWTYHRDHLTLPTAKARRELPPQDIKYATDATLRGVVSFEEAKRRAASPSPCRPQGQRRENAPGSAVSRAVSLGSTMTAQTGGRRPRPRSCLPRAPTPQPGQEELTIQLAPLLPRKSFSKRHSRSQTPTFSVCSEQSWDSVSANRNIQLPQAENSSVTKRPPARNASCAQRPPTGISRPATATTVITRKSRSSSRPSTAVSRRTRWSDIADDAVSLNSSILELLQTITATDGKLRPLSPRADRARTRSEKPPSPETDYSEYPITTTNNISNTEILSDSDDSEYHFVVTSNFRQQNESETNLNSTNTGRKAETELPVHNGIKTCKCSYLPLAKGSDVKTAADFERKFVSNKSEKDANPPLPQENNRQFNIETIRPSMKTASMDFGEKQSNMKLSPKHSPVSVGACHCHGNSKHVSEFTFPCRSASPILGEIASPGSKALVLSGCGVTDHQVDVGSNKEMFMYHQKYAMEKSQAYTLEEQVPSHGEIMRQSSQDNIAPKVKYDHDDGKLMDSCQDKSEYNISNALTENPEIPLSLSQPSSVTGRSSTLSSEESVSHAEYLLINETAMKNETNVRSHEKDQTDGDGHGQINQQLERGEDTD